MIHVLIRGTTHLTKDRYWPSEVATILGVSKMTVYRWIQQGTITPILRIRPYKIARAEIEKLLSLQ
jgi:excisionase family DNA binding protein